MDTLLKVFGTKAAIAKAMNIRPEAVYNAFRREVVPTTWLPMLKQKGLSKAQLEQLPLDDMGRKIVSAFEAHP